MESTTLSQDVPARRPGVRTPPVLAWLRLVRIFQKIDRLSAERLRCRRLSVAQFDVLAKVGSLDGPTQQELADALLVTKGNICQLIDRMEASGLLYRRQEGRTNRLFLTVEGRALYRTVIPAHEQDIVGMFSGLTAEEQNQLLELLRKLDRSLA